jgi:hypothetical protein
MAVVAVVSTAASIATEVQAAQAQNKAIGQELRQGQQQVDEQHVSDLNNRARQARVEQGRMAVAAGEAGLQLSSGSVENMLLDSAMQQKQANEATDLNAQNQQQNLLSEANRMYSQVQQPTVVGAGLRLVTAGVTGYAQGKSMTVQRQGISQSAARAASG